MRTLYIKNFGPIPEAKIEVHRFNLFIGDQSIGKSTLAKLITIFTDYLNLTALLLDLENSWEKMITRYDLQTCINAEKDYTIIYDEQVRDISIHIQIEKGKRQGYALKNQQSISNDSEIVQEVLGSKRVHHRQKWEEAQNIKDDIGLKKSLGQLLRNSLYIPAERSIASIVQNIAPVIMMAKEQIPNNLLQFTLELGNAKSSFPNQKVNVLNLSYRKENDEDTIVLYDGQLLPLKYASSGIQSALPLILTVLYGIHHKEYDSFVVEEPECNLFPQKQVELLQFLIDQIYYNSRMLTITTHSPYLLSALNNYLYASALSKTMPEAVSQLEDIVPSSCWLQADNCAIYSLGERINGGSYCKNLVDSDTGLIDFNYLDGVSITMGEEFGKLQDIQIAFQRKQKKNKKA